MNEYTSKDIKVLEGIDHIRQRPGMYIGTTSITGVYNLIEEVIDNSVDEYLNDKCDYIEVEISKENWIRVKDNGRGIPFEEMELTDGTKVSALEIVITKLNAGGKFDKGKDKAFHYSSGLHGVGVTAVNALSSEMRVEVVRNGQKAKLTLQKGKPVSKCAFTKSQLKSSYTDIAFLPDASIFQSIDIDPKVVLERIQELALLNKDLKFKFIDNKTNLTRDICYHNGIKDYLGEISKGKEIYTQPIFAETKSEDKYELGIGIQWLKSSDSWVKGYVNSIFTEEGGTHINGFQTGIVETFKDLVLKMGYKGKFDNGNLIEDITYSDIKEGMSCIISLKLQDPEFQGQTKSKLGNPEITAIVKNLTVQIMNEALYKNRKELIPVMENILLNIRAKIAAKKARDEVKSIKDVVNTSKKALPGKLWDCKNPKEGNLYLCEGESCVGTFKISRDSTTDAIYPLTGKIINALKAKSIADVVESEKIKPLIAALGVELGDKFKIEDLRYKNIIIAADADIDGLSIQLLVITLFYVLWPKIITEGRLLIVQAPLYRIRAEDGTYFVYSEEEKEQLLKTKKAKEITRFKGLGEMDPEDVEPTLLHKENQKLIKLTIEDAKLVKEQMDILMGDNIEGRKKYLEEMI